MLRAVVNPYTALGERVRSFEDFNVSPSRAAADNVANWAELAAYTGTARRIYAKDDTYAFNDSLEINVDDLHIDMGPGTILDFSSSASSNTYITAAGTAASSTSLTADATKGDRTISISSAVASTLVADQPLRIYSTEGWAPIRLPNSKCGEMGIVHSVDGGVVTLTAPLKDSYTVANGGAVEPITPRRNLIIEGGKILGAAGNQLDIGLVFQRCVDVLVRNLHIDNVDTTQLTFNDVFRAEVTGCRFDHIVTHGLGYGVSVTNAAEQINIHHNQFFRNGHAFTVGTGNDHGGQPRFIYFTNNFVHASEPNYSLEDGSITGYRDAVDTHATGEFIYILDNDIIGARAAGVNIEASNVWVCGNRIVGADGNGIQASPHTSRAGSIVVENNTVIRAQETAIRIALSEATLPTYTSVHCNNNRCFNTGDTALYVAGLTTLPMVDVQVNENTVRDFGEDTSPLAGVVLLYCDGLIVEGNLVDMTSNATYTGMRMQDVKSASVSGNVLKKASGASNPGIYLRAASAGATTDVAFSGNVVKGDSPSSSSGVLIESNCRNVQIGANSFDGVTTPISSINHTIAAGVVQLRGDIARHITIDTEGSAATDDLDTINGGMSGQILLISATNAARTVVLKDGTGNLKLSGDITLDNTEDVVALVYITSASHWRQISFTDSGA